MSRFSPMKDQKRAHGPTLKHEKHPVVALAATENPRHIIPERDGVRTKAVSGEPTSDGEPCSNKSWAEAPAGRRSQKYEATWRRRRARRRARLNLHSHLCWGWGGNARFHSLRNYRALSGADSTGG